MSLQVWFPFTKDLRNQGLANVEQLAGTSSFKDTGKIGSKSLNLHNYVTFTCSALSGKKNFSFCFWYKPESSSSTVNWNDVVAFFDSAGGLFRLETSYGYSNYVLSMHNNTSYGIMPNSSGSYGSNLLISGARDIWYHVAVVVSEENGINCYINNELKFTIAHAGGSITGKFNLGEYNSAGNEEGSLNDFRLYDHCLSPMEIKEISKGLVAHYLLNNNGLGQENLLPVSGSSILTSTQSFEFQDWVQNFYTKTWVNEHLTPGKQYTLSYTVTCLSIPDSSYSFKEKVASPILVHQGRGWSQVTTTSDGIKDTNMSVGQSRHYVCTFTFETATETYEYYGLCGYTALYRNSSNNAQYARFRIDNLKLEEGPSVTTWSPAPTDELSSQMGLNSNIEYDTSGFQNNGVRTGTFNWTSNTPKYQVSSYFNGANYILTDSGTFSWFDFNQLTLAGWMNPTNSPSSYSGSFGIAHDSIDGYYSKCFSISNSSSKFTINAARGNTWTWITSSYTVPANEWHHYVATLNGAEVKMYVDGELIYTTTIDWNTAKVASDTRVQVGVDLPGSDETYQGYYSDIRIYTTALSEEDVKSLYNFAKF